MAGLNARGEFPELITPYLRELISLTGGSDGPIGKQFVKSQLEEISTYESNDRHWHAEGDLPRGLERLYDGSAVIDLTMNCAAHCRYCLRSQYESFDRLSDSEIVELVDYISFSNIKEVLITGGDPLLNIPALTSLVEELLNLTDVEVFRVATRLFTHNPKKVDITDLAKLVKMCDRRLEIATQINHVTEFTEEAISAIKHVQNLGVTIYSQNVLLRGVNDDIDSLADLYNAMRKYGIESHYLFHCVPMKGTSHFRTSVKKGINLTNELVNSGRISGRCKPQFALMTDIGKVTLLPNSIVGMELGKDFEEYFIIKTGYTKSQRVENNQGYVFPNSVSEVDGFLNVLYLDGKDI